MKTLTLLFSLPEGINSAESCNSGGEIKDEVEAIEPLVAELWDAESSIVGAGDGDFPSRPETLWHWERLWAEEGRI